MTSQTREPLIISRSSHPISRKDIDPEALKVLYRLTRNGFKAYLVGGAVRDLLLGRKPKDFDVATDARPGQIKKLFANCFLIGKRFRLAHIRFKGGKIIEVATFRKEPDETAEGTGDHNNTFGTPREDAFRRDITINGLFYDISNFSIIDYVGGLKDILQKRICIIGDPAMRYGEDPVRMWRVLRYSSRQKFSIEHNTAGAIEANRDLLATCSGSRLYEELNKDLLSGYAGVLIRKMTDCSLLSIILGDVGRIIEETPGLASEVVRMLAILDESVRRNEQPSSVISYGMLLWPWAHQVIMEKGHLNGDKMKLLVDELEGSGMSVTMPKALKANVIHALEILERMMSAIETGRMRWSLTKKASYKEAASMFALIAVGRLIHGHDAFMAAFREKFPFRDIDKLHKKRRRRFRKRRPSSFDEQGLRLPAPNDHETI
ncbi:MAG TPA: polynucleotide adenylyltransferase PcnB [Desulfomonilia bacterium]|nr:polynucleotide adenylyltransferase PcnB [Desulfomonilia bacterium]